MSKLPASWPGMGNTGVTHTRMRASGKPRRRKIMVVGAMDRPAAAAAKGSRSGVRPSGRSRTQSAARDASDRVPPATGSSKSWAASSFSGRACPAGVTHTTASWTAASNAWKRWRSAWS
ncbi:hypothetical protein D3C72_903960 [compost metagenome]